MIVKMPQDAESSVFSATFGFTQLVPQIVQLVLPVDEAHSGLLHLKVSGDFQSIRMYGLQPTSPTWQPIAYFTEVLKKALIIHKLTWDRSIHDLI